MKVLRSKMADGQNLFAIPQSDSCHLITTDDTTVSTITVPSPPPAPAPSEPTVKFALFSSTKDFMAGFGTVPILPGAFPGAGIAADTTVMELNPTLRIVTPGQVITMCAAIVGEEPAISITFYG